MTQWVAVDTNVGDDPRIWKVAELCGVSAEAAVGLHVMLLAKVSEHKPDGDLTSVSDGLLEKWSGWRGMPYAFAPHYRALFVNAEGKLTGWGEINGKHLKKLAKERKRWHERNRDDPIAEEHEPQPTTPRSRSAPLRGASAEAPPPTSHDTTSQEVSTSLPTARERFLASLPTRAARVEWGSALDAWLGGMDLAPGLKATDADIESALGDFLRNGKGEPNSRFVRKHVESRIRDRRRAEADAADGITPIRRNGSMSMRDMAIAGAKALEGIHED